MFSMGETPKPPPLAIPPVGFGPIAADWRARRALLGPKAASAFAQGWDEQPLPDDLDANFFNVAPPDQRPERIDPGSRLVLESLSAQHPRLTTSLPGARPRAFADRGKGLEELTLICDTLWIDTDGGVATLTWRAQIGLASRQEEGRVLLLLDHPTRPLTWDEIQAQCAGAVADAPRRRPYVAPPESSGMLSEDRTQATQAFRAGRASFSALPFVEAAAEAPPAPPRPAAPTAPPWLNVTPPPPPINAGETSAIKITGGGWTFDEQALPKAKPAPAPPGATLPIPSPPSLATPSMGASALSALSASALSPTPLSAPPLSAPSSLSAPSLSPPLPPPPAPVPPPQVGVLSVSNLAAAANLTAASAAPEPVAAPAPLAASAFTRPKTAPGEIVDLLWFDPAAPDRARLHIPWQDLIIRMNVMPPEADPDDDPSRDPPEIKDRRDLLGVLTEAEPTPLEDLDAVLAAATTPTGGLLPPLVLLTGELEPSLDEVESLTAALAAAAPFATGSDKKLKDAFDQVTEALKSPWAQGSPRAAEALTTRIREAFPPGAWSLPSGWLEQQIERAVVEKRAYQKRKVLGKTLLRATLTQRGSAISGGVPTYLAAEVSEALPLYARFPVRIVAEVHLQQDAYESLPYALRALALARVGSAGKGGAKPAGGGRGR